MLISIKRTILISVIGLSCVILPGCKSFNYHQSEDDLWLTEQVEKGYLTQQEVDQLKKQ